MKLYFYSPVRAIVSTTKSRLTIGKNVTTADVEPDETLTIFPFGFKSSTVCLAHPEINENAAIIDVYDGFLVTPVLKPKALTTRKTYFEKQISVYGARYLVSVKAKNEVSVRIEGYDSRAEAVCEFEPSDVTVTVVKNSVVILLKGEASKLFVFETPSLKLALELKAKKITVSDTTVVAEKVLRGGYEYVRSVQYSLSPVKKANSYLDKSGNHRDNELIRALCFFEALNYGGDATEYLASSLKEKIEQLKAFIPAWKILLPPFKESNKTFCLVGKQAFYAKPSFQNGLICDIDVGDEPL